MRPKNIKTCGMKLRLKRGLNENILKSKEDNGQRPKSGGLFQRF